MGDLKGQVTVSAKICPLDAPSWPRRPGIYVGSKDFFALISGRKFPLPSAC